MASDVKLTADSSPTQILKSMTPAQHKAWRETGATPEIAEEVKETKTETAESSTAAETELTEQPEKVAEETIAASVTAKQEPSKPSKGAEGRLKEVLSDRKRLTEENKKLAAELESLRKTPMVAPAKIEEVAKPRRNDVDEKTGLPVYASDESFDEAYESYLTTKVTKDVESRHAKQQQEARKAEEHRITLQRYGNSVELAKGRHPDFEKVCQIDEKGAYQHPDLKNLKTNGMVDSFCLDSEICGEMVYYFASHPGEAPRIDSMNSFAASRVLTRLEDKLLQETSTSQPAKKEEKPEGSKRVTGAPAPAASVGGRATAPADEAEAAIQAGDFRRYKKAADEEDFRKKKAS